MDKIKEYIGYIIIIILIILVRTYFVTPVRVNGDSMDNTLANGQYLLLRKTKDISFEDIVVVNKDFEGSPLIKRVIGMPGDTIECEDGILYINGKKYDDSYAYGTTTDFEKVTLKEDEYYLLGDNRLVSKDSRYLGPVNIKYIEGKIIYRLFPFSKFGTVK